MTCNYVEAKHLGCYTGPHWQRDRGSHELRLRASACLLGFAEGHWACGLEKAEWAATLGTEGAGRAVEEREGRSGPAGMEREQAERGEG